MTTDRRLSLVVGHPTEPAASANEPVDRLNEDRGPSYIEVRVYPGTDVTVSTDFYDVDLPVVRIGCADRFDIQIRPHSGSMTGETELAAADELAQAAKWYAREVRTIVERNRTDLAEEAGGWPDAAGSASELTELCPAWCDPASCTTAQAGGQHYSQEVGVEASGSEVCSAALSLSQSPGGKTLVTVEAQHDPDISAALDMSNEPDVFIYTLDQAERVWRALGRLLDAA